MAQALIRIFLLHSSLAGLVVFAERLNPIPSRTRPLNFPAPMVLSLKAWKSRSLPGLPRTRSPQHDDNLRNGRRQWRPFLFSRAALRKRRATPEASAAAFCEIKTSEKPSRGHAPSLLQRRCAFFPTRPFPATATSPLPQPSVFSWFHGRSTKSELLRPSHRAPPLLHSARNARAMHRASRFGAGWSSPVARQAHNLKVVGSNPTPATIKNVPPPLVEAAVVF